LSLKASRFWRDAFYFIGHQSDPQAEFLLSNPISLYASLL